MSLKNVPSGLSDIMMPSCDVMNAIFLEKWLELLKNCQRFFSMKYCISYRGNTLTYLSVLGGRTRGWYFSGKITKVCCGWGVVIKNGVG